MVLPTNKPNALDFPYLVTAAAPGLLQIYKMTGNSGEACNSFLICGVFFPIQYVCRENYAL